MSDLSDKSDRSDAWCAAEIGFSGSYCGERAKEYNNRSLHNLHTTQAAKGYANQPKTTEKIKRVTTAACTTNRKDGGPGEEICC